VLLSVNISILSLFVTLIFMITVFIFFKVIPNFSLDS
jgi:hypothetical protein